MIGILLPVYGLVRSVDEIEPFYTHIFHGQPPGEARLKDAIWRYRQLGTCDPLASVTLRQAEALERRIGALLLDEVRVYVGCKHTPPFVPDAVEQMIRDGVRRVATLPVTPLYTRSGTGSYRKQVRDALQRIGVDLPVVDIEGWWAEPRFVDLLGRRLRSAVNWLSAEGRSDFVVLFTAHSQPGLPQANERFCTEFEALAANVARAAGGCPWRLAYRSGGPAPQVWLGPDVREVIEAEAAAGRKAVVVCELMSMTENVEVLYDAGIDCWETATRHGMEFARTEFLNDAYEFMDMLSRYAARRIRCKDDAYGTAGVLGT
ncbi:ferrochelatase [Paenibacillus elgii]|uniref:ferrochelatase n=1 Tax=Paenibacillus elgii TaxID=189691 RepID=UPI00203E3346|nr:ferrochelatase [Paenibacillus elgii]MCM3270139.1 ferrochelatase [Paenibacillus elgii]